MFITGNKRSYGSFYGSSNQYGSNFSTSKKSFTPYYGNNLSQIGKGIFFPTVVQKYRSSIWNTLKYDNYFDTGYVMFGKYNKKLECNDFLTLPQTEIEFSNKLKEEFNNIWDSIYSKIKSSGVRINTKSLLNDLEDMKKSKDTIPFNVAKYEKKQIISNKPNYIYDDWKNQNKNSYGGKQSIFDEYNRNSLDLFSLSRILRKWKYYGIISKRESKDGMHSYYNTSKEYYDGYLNGDDFGYKNNSIIPIVSEGHAYMIVDEEVKPFSVCYWVLTRQKHNKTTTIYPTFRLVWGQSHEECLAKISNMEFVEKYLDLEYIEDDVLYELYEKETLVKERVINPLSEKMYGYIGKIGHLEKEGKCDGVFSDRQYKDMYSLSEIGNYKTNLPMYKIIMDVKK